MKKQEFIDSIQAIGTCEDDAQRRTLLATLSEEVTKVFDEHAELTTSNEQFKLDNEELRSANMKLFKQVGAQKIVENPMGEEHKEEPQLTYENLFNEKGELK